MLQSFIVSDPYNAGMSSVSILLAEKEANRVSVFTVLIKCCGRHLYLKGNQEKEEIAGHFDKH